jgi:hypothetical protein
MKRLAWKVAGATGVLAAAPFATHLAHLAYGTHRFGIH